MRVSRGPFGVVMIVVIVAALRAGASGASGQQSQSGSRAADFITRSEAITADTTRRRLLGTWEPDVVSDLPPGSNTVTYLEDGFYLNPFRAVALVGTWSATADSTMMTPLEIRKIETGEAVPEAKELDHQADLIGRRSIPGERRCRSAAPLS